jgi:23S rRNA (pseudouridine1915-N3)-methyltransferase
LKAFHLICVGKLKDAHLEAIEKDYLKRITLPPLFIHEVKASAENKDSEAEAIEKKLKDIGEPVYKIAMSEWGKTHTSVEFAALTNKLFDQNLKTAFIIAGAEGFSEKFLGHCHSKLSLSALTMPHKLARIVLVEQIYRAQTINNKHPYHN